MNDVAVIEKPAAEKPAASLTLYEVFDELAAWSNSLEMAETDEETAEIQERISRYLQQGKLKVDRFSQFLVHLEAQATLCAAEANRITSRKWMIQKIQDRLQDYAISTMEALGTRSLGGDTSSLSLRKIRDVAEITNLDALPDKFKVCVMRVPKEYMVTILECFPGSVVIDIETPKDPILKALQAKEEVPGAHIKTNDANGHGHNCLIRK